MVIGEPVVSSAGGGGDGVQTLSPEENYERKGETTSHLGKKSRVQRKSVSKDCQYENMKV